jgi:hypothetical protein
MHDGDRSRHLRSAADASQAASRTPRGAFSLLRFADRELPDVVYLEHLTRALYLDKRDEVERYLDVMELLCVDSEPPAKIVDLLTKILKKL